MENINEKEIQIPDFSSGNKPSTRSKEPYDEKSFDFLRVGDPSVSKKSERTEIEIPSFLANRSRYASDINIEKSYKKSTEERRPTSQANIKRKKYTKKQCITAIIAAAVIAATAVASSAITINVNNLIEQSEKEDTLNMACSDYLKMINHAMDEAAIKETTETGYNQVTYGKIVDYDESIIASEIKSSTNSNEERDIAIFTLYKKYGKTTGNAALNDITTKTVTHFAKDDGTNYEGLDDYINDLGYKNKDEYEEKMSNKIIVRYNYRQEYGNNEYGGK